MPRTASATPGTPGDVARRAVPAGARAAVVVGLLFCFMLVNFADKVAVGLAGDDLMAELGLSKQQFGLVQSSFFWLLAVGAVLGGLLIGRIKARFLLGGAAAVWALSLAPMTGSLGLGTLIACRVVLGLAEGPAVAMATAVTHTWYPPEKRAVPTSVVLAGAAVGPLVAAPALTWVMLRFDWHAAFTVLLVAGIAWVLTWLFAGREGPVTDRPADDASPVAATVSYRALLSTGTVVGLLVLFFTSYWSIAVTISWLPLYLRDGLGYRAGEAGALAALPYGAAAVFQVLAGMVSARMSRRGASSRSARTLLAAGLAGAGGLSTIGFALSGRGPVQLGLIVVAALTTAGYGVAMAAVSDVVPARRRGGVMGVIVGVYGLGGIIAPLVFGRLVDSAVSPSAGYTHGFLLVGTLAVAGAAVAAVLADPERDVRRLTASRA